jgi:hypothetical protein
MKQSAVHPLCHFNLVRTEVRVPIAEGLERLGYLGLNSLLIGATIIFAICRVLTFLVKLQAFLLKLQLILLKLKLLLKLILLILQLPRSFARLRQLPSWR